MVTPKLDRFTDSSIFKIGQSVLTAVLTAAVLGVGSGLLDRLSRVESQLADARVDKATFEMRVQHLEKEDADKRLLMLEFKVEDLQRGPVRDSHK